MKRQIIALLTGAALACASPAMAQSNDLYAPVLTHNSAPSSYFSGAYAGADVGLINNNKNTFFTNVNTYRIPVGVFAGYNFQLTPWLLAGGELSGDITWDWQSGTTGYNLFANARVGALASDDFLFFYSAGLGTIDGRAAFSLGIGGEQAITDNFSVRAQAVSYGQLGAPAGVINYGGITAMKLTAGALWHFDNDSQSRQLHNAGWGETTKFIGPYLGVYGGLTMNPTFNFFQFSPLSGWHQSRFSHGVIAGWNYALSDMFRAGVEVQGGMTNDTSGSAGWDAQLLGRAGITPFDGALIYATAGLGVVENRGAYAVGGGVEYALWGKNSLRLDFQALGEVAPVVAGNNGITAYKGTIGALWHLDQ